MMYKKMTRRTVTENHEEATEIINRIPVSALPTCGKGQRKFGVKE
jgi:hypothetical protein